MWTSPSSHDSCADLAGGRQRQHYEVSRARDLREDGEQLRGWYNEFSCSQVEPSARRAYRRGALTVPAPDLVLNHESRTVGAHREYRIRDGHGVVQTDFAEVLQLLLTHHRAERQPTEFARWEAVLGEECHAHIGRQVQVGGVCHVAIEVHGRPAGEELSGVALLGG